MTEKFWCIAIQYTVDLDFFILIISSIQIIQNGFRVWLPFNFLFILTMKYLDTSWVKIAWSSNLFSCWILMLLTHCTIHLSLDPRVYTLTRYQYQFLMITWYIKIHVTSKLFSLHMRPTWPIKKATQVIWNIYSLKFVQLSWCILKLCSVLQAWFNFMSAGANYTCIYMLLAFI